MLVLVALGCYGTRYGRVYKTGMAGLKRSLWLVAAAMSAFSQVNIDSQETREVSAVAHAWDTLKDGVADSDVEHRKNAVAAIGIIGADPQAVRMVQLALQDKDPQVRQTAAATLGQMGSKKRDSRA